MLPRILYTARDYIILYYINYINYITTLYTLVIILDRIKIKNVICVLHKPYRLVIKRTAAIKIIVSSIK